MRVERSARTRVEKPVDAGAGTGVGTGAMVSAQKLALSAAAILPLLLAGVGAAAAGIVGSGEVPGESAWVATEGRREGGGAAEEGRMSIT
jgi:hypothetical protein